MENHEGKKSDTNKNAGAEETHEEHEQAEDQNGQHEGGEDHGEEGKHDGDDKGEHHEGEEGHDPDEQLPAEIQQTSEQDARSVYVKNVDYSSTKEEVTEFFKSCGKINRVTLITDKYTGNPKGFAYIEFADKEGAENAMYLSDSTFKGRNITVTPKRTNVPYRGRGGRGRRFSGGRGGFFPMRRGYGMFSMRPMRRGGFRPY